MQVTLPAHRIETTLNQDGSLALERLPFRAGQAVEVIILPHHCDTPVTNRYPLRGTSVRYDQPLEPVAQDDWDTLK